jgi:hypothetical protein
MAHLRACRAAVGGKRRGSKPRQTAAILTAAISTTGISIAEILTTEIFKVIRRPALAAVAVFGVALLFWVALAGSPSYAQSGPFAGMAGNWSGGGTVTLDDGSSERIRCRATYAVGAGGNGLNQNLTCASDSYKFDLRSNVIAEGGALSGTWSESSRGVNGTLQGRGAAGNFQAVASAAGFNASISLATRGNRQSVVIRGEGQFRGASISLSRH